VYSLKQAIPMNKLVLHPTATSQWHAIVTEASNKCKTKLPEDIESYLVFLLMRTIDSTTLLHRIMATELLSSLHQSDHKKQQLLQAVGDSCLLFSGLFPGCARRRRVRISYYVKLGQTAYNSLAEYVEEHCTDLFISLSKYFVPLMDILQMMRDLENSQHSLDLLQAEELWNDTKSTYALKILQGSTTSPLLISTDLISTAKH
jgi:hypothetical protein